MRNTDQFGERYEQDRPGRYKEGRVGRAIENQTAKVPSDLFLWIAGGAIVGSLTLKAFGKKDKAGFVGRWVPTILAVGVYNKMVKLIRRERNFSAAA